MGKIRVAKLGDESQEKELKRRAEARRQTKASKKPFDKAQGKPFDGVYPEQRRGTQGKAQIKGVGLKGGERIKVVEGTEIKAEYKKLIEEVEKGAAPESPATQAKQKKKIKVRTRSRRYQEALKLIERNKFYPLPEAIALVKKTSLTRFDGTVEAHLVLNPATYSDKNEKKDFRGTVTFPHGTGKKVRVIIADDQILSEIEQGKINFEILVAQPSFMPKLAKLAKILGPKGLMPNPKNGTVTDNPEKRVKELSQGQVNFKTEPNNPLIHLPVGKVSFEDKKLSENVTALLDAVGRSKIIKITLSATMGPGVKVQIN